MGRSRKPFIPNKLRPWIEARRRFHLSHAQVQMARELGMNPKKLGKLANHDQEPWKLPLPAFIEACYRKRFGRAAPEQVLSIEEKAQRDRARKEERKRRRAEAREEQNRNAGARPAEPTSGGEP